MSTQFFTKPSIQYDDFCERTNLKVETPPRPLYMMPHVLLRKGDDTLWAFNDGGGVRFERFGAQNPELLLDVVEQFGVEIYDEYGLKYPEQSSG